MCSYKPTSEPGILYITRKFPPSLGGMQVLNFELTNALSQFFPVRVIAWGYAQVFLPFFLVYALSSACCHLATSKTTKVIVIGDGLLAPLGYLLKKLFGRPTVVILHGLDLLYPSIIYQALILPFIKRMNSLICNSAATRNIALEKGIASEKIYIIPPAVNPNKFLLHSKKIAREYLSENLRIDINGRFVLLFIGRLIERKGIHWFLDEVVPELVKQYPMILLLITGEGPMKDVLHSTIHARCLSKSVQMLGAVNDDTLSYLYRASDLFIMPNVSVKNDIEGFGIVAREAAVNELYVVASDVDGIKDAVSSEKIGMLVEARNAQKYLQTISSLIDSSGQSKDRGIEARKECLVNGTWDTITKEYLEIFREYL